MNNTNENPFLPFQYDRNLVFNQNYYLPLMGQNYQYQIPKTMNGINYLMSPSPQPTPPMVQNYYNCQPAFNAVQCMAYGYNSEVKYNNFNNHLESNKIFQNSVEEGKVKKIRRDRTTYSKAQLQILEKYFQKNSYPDVTVRENIAAQIQISELNIQVWFKNRRAKQKRLSGKTSRDKPTSNAEENLSNNTETAFVNKSNSDNLVVNPGENLNFMYPMSCAKEEIVDKNETKIGHLYNYNNFPLPNFNKDQNYYMNYQNYVHQMGDL